jgi:hypothetical protein
MAVDGCSWWWAAGGVISADSRICSEGPDLTNPSKYPSLHPSSASFDQK